VARWRGVDADQRREIREFPVFLPADGNGSSRAIGGLLLCNESSMVSTINLNEIIVQFNSVVAENRNDSGKS
jgi:hypothetical protein